MFLYHLSWFDLYIYINEISDIISLIIVWLISKRDCRFLGFNNKHVLSRFCFIYSPMWFISCCEIIDLIFFFVSLSFYPLFMIFCHQYIDVMSKRTRPSGQKLYIKCIIVLAYIYVKNINLFIRLNILTEFDYSITRDLVRYFSSTSCDDRMTFLAN